jgi:hypothetical protein
VELVAQPAISLQKSWSVLPWRKGKGGEQMRKRITLLIAALMMALSMSFGSVAAFAAIEEGNGNGHPNTTPSGKCPAGQNKDTSPGGLKKCG